MKSRRRGWVLLCRLVVTILVVFSTARAESYDMLLDAADSVCSAGLIDSAATLGLKALDLSTIEFGDDDTAVATVLHHLGRYLYINGEFDSAATLWTKALDIRERKLGPETVPVANLLNNLGEATRRMARYDESESYQLRALALREKLLGPDDLEVATSLNNLAVLYSERSDFERAEEFHNRALELSERILGPDDSRVGWILNAIGVNYYRENKLVSAEEALIRALDIRLKIMSPISKGVSQIQGNLGLVYQKMGRYTEAESLLVASLTAIEAVKGKGDFATVSALGYLGSLYYCLGRYDECADLYRRTLDIETRTLGPEHPDVAQTLSSLAGVYWMRADYAEAESSYRKALDIFETSYGEDHWCTATCLLNLGISCVSQGRYNEAIPLYERALAIQLKVGGPDNPDVADVLHSMAFAEMHLGRLAEAETLFVRALKMREELLGLDHPKIARSAFDLALLYMQQGRYREAEPLFSRALTINRATLGEEHREVSEGYWSLALMMQRQGRYTEADSLYKKTLSIEKQVYGEEHPDLAETLRDMGSLCADQGRYDEAIAFFERALRMQRKLLGDEHPEVAGTMQVLADACVKEGKTAEADSLYRGALSRRIAAQGESVDLVPILLGLGRLETSRHNYERADSLLNRALGIAERVLGPDHLQTGEVAHAYGELCAARGDIEAAVGYFSRAFGVRHGFIDYVFSFSSDAQKLRWIGKYPLIDDSFISLALEHPSRNTLRASLEMVLKGKAAVLDALMSQAGIAQCSEDGVVTEIVQQHSRLCNMIAAMALNGTGECQPDRYRDSLEALVGRKDSLEAVLSWRCAGYHEALAERRFGVDDVAGGLPENSVLWEFVRCDVSTARGSGHKSENRTDYIALTLTNDGAITITDLGEARHIDSLVYAVRGRLYAAGSDVYSPRLEELCVSLDKTAAELYAVIFAPLEGTLEGRRRILAAPDAALCLLPLEILPLPDGRYAVEEFTISYLSAGRDVLRGDVRHLSHDATVFADPDFDAQPASAGLLASVTAAAPPTGEPEEVAQSIPFGCLRSGFSPLRFSRTEAEQVSEVLRDDAHLKVRSLLGPDAREEALKGLDHAPYVLHLATHGQVCGDSGADAESVVANPLLRSGLALAGANSWTGAGASTNDDGILTALEASTLRLVGTEITVLSACETGVGSLQAGEGVFSLSRAFQHAGSESVIMSLWKVPDKEARDLMTGFYEHWSSGDSKADALRRAQLDVIDSLRTRYGVAHALFWGGFVLNGDFR